ncbi:MAG: hypothetical protein IKN53_04760 [Oscillibacter sp.]|nr:hypothetical protein [Oscillibacter sp.]
MTGRVFTADHRVFDLPAPIAWNVTHTGSVPCDSWSMRIVYREEMAPILRLAAGFAAIENGETMLRGIVDEYTVRIDASGASAELCGRGYAARLLDNESRPLTYEGATLAEIVKNHVTPYGISCAELADVRAQTVYTVAAGVSQWRALSDFCRVYGGFLPRFSKDGKLLAAPEKRSGKAIVIGRDAPIIRSELREDHYGVLTEALVIDKKRNTTYSVKNQDMIDLGGQCRRVLYTPGQSTWDAMRYTGEYQIAQSKKREFALVLTLPGSFRAFPGERVRLETETWGRAGTYRLAEAENAFSAETGATMTWMLRKEET